MANLLFEWFGISCTTTDNFCFYLQNSLIQTSQTGGQWYSDTSPLIFPALTLSVMDTAVTISINDTQHRRHLCLCAVHRYAECVLMLSVT
jgi:hypothetical protein